MEKTSPFQRIYVVVSHIPKGKVTTYKEVARAAKIRNPRIVGFALHANKSPDRVPCHRVIKTNGMIAKGYAFGGAKAQEEKLKQEGVPLLHNHRVDLARCLYQPALNDETALE